MNKVTILKIGASVVSMAAGVVVSKVLHSMIPDTKIREKNTFIYGTDKVSE